MSDVTFNMASNLMEVHHKYAEPWRVTLVDTGEATMTGGRLKRVAPYICDEEVFCFTYGDGLSDLDVDAQIAFHRAHGNLATVTAVQPQGRYGALELRGTAVTGFIEKPQGDGGWINGGFFVLSPKVLPLVADDTVAWELGPMQELAARGKLQAFYHRGFWHPMDTLRDKLMLEESWWSGKAPWKKWA
jgi:glucose-1-phosphate cytidylyltransferase